MFKMNRKYFFRKERKWIRFFHNISSTVLKGLDNKKTRVIFSAWKKICLLDFLKISQKSCEDFLVSMTSSRPELFCKKGFLRNFTKFTGKRLCQILFFNKEIQKVTLAQVFSCEFCEITKNSFTENVWTTAKTNSLFKDKNISLFLYN